MHIAPPHSNNISLVSEMEKCYKKEDEMKSLIFKLLMLLLVFLVLSECSNKRSGESNCPGCKPYDMGKYVGYNLAIDTNGDIFIPTDDTRSSAIGVTKLSPTAGIIKTYSLYPYVSTGINEVKIAIDMSGEIVVTSAPSPAYAVKLNQTGNIFGNSISIYPSSMVIDADGNILVGGDLLTGERGAYAGIGIIKLNSQGITINTYSLGFSSSSYVTTTSGTFISGAIPSLSDIAIDKPGNIWVSINTLNIPCTEAMTITQCAEAEYYTGTVMELSSLGVTLQTFTTDTQIGDIAIDPAGNIWITNSDKGTITKFNPNGMSLGTFDAGSYPSRVAIDQAGNIWILNNTNMGMVTELSSNGTFIKKFGVGYYPTDIAIDAKGNVWVIVLSTVIEIPNVANGPQYFPYTGPQWPGG